MVRTNILPIISACSYLLYRVIGLPEEEDWPIDVALPRNAFASQSPQPIELLVTDIDELGKDLLLVSICHSKILEINSLTQNKKSQQYI